MSSSVSAISSSVLSVPASQRVREPLEGLLEAIEGALPLLGEGFSTHRSAIADLRLQWSSPFALFVCGEFNSGKSSLINALSGEGRCPVGVLPTTAHLEEVRIGDILYIDSPGLNSIFQEHQLKSERYSVRADAVLFVTSVERPLSGSELRFLETVTGTWRKEVFIVLNKTDLVDETGREAIVRFLESSLRSLGIGTDKIFCVSSSYSHGIDQLRGIEGLRSALIAYFSSEAQVRIKVDALRAAATQIGREVLKALDSRIATVEQTRGKFIDLTQRFERRMSDAPRVIGSAQSTVETLFRSMADKLDDLIDERIGLSAILRARVMGRRDEFRARVQGMIGELNCERRLEEVVRGTAERLDAYLSGVRDEFRAVLEGGVSHGEPLRREDIPMIEVDAIASRINQAVESGLSQLLTAGSLAALSGVGAKISTVTPVEVSATIAMIGLGTYSLRAFPMHRRRVKREVRQAFEEMAQSFVNGINEGVNRTLSQVREGFQRWTEPRISEIVRELEEFRVPAARLRGFVELGSGMAVVD